MMHSSFEIRVKAGFVVAVLVVAALAATAWKASQNAVDAALQLAHDHEVLSSFAQARGDVLLLEASTRAYIISGDAARLVERDAAISMLETTLRRIEAFTVDNVLLEGSSPLRAAVTARLATAGRSVLLRTTEGFEAARVYNSGPEIIETRERVLRLLREMVEEHNRLREAHIADQLRARWFTTALSVLAAIGLIALLSTTYALILNQMRTTEAARKALERASIRTSAILDTIADGIIIIDEHGIVETLNPAAERMFGYAAAEVSGRNLNMLMPQPCRSEHDGYLERYLATGEARAIGSKREVTGRRNDGNTFPIELAVTEMWQGGERHFTGVVHDITERRRADAQLRLQATALDAAANSIVITDRDGTILWVNSAFTKLTGYSPEEAIGQNPGLLNSGVQDAEFFRGMYQTILAGSVWRGEIVNRYKDGRLGAEEMTITPLRGEDGEITHFIAIKQDITERKAGERAARYLHEAVEAIPEGFALFDPDDRLVLCNRPYLELYQLGDRGAVEGRSFEQLLRHSLARGDYPAAIGREEEWLAARLQAHRNPGLPFEQCLPDGRWLRISECRLSDGSIAGLRSDISELKRAQRDAERAVQAAEAASRAKSEFLAAMSHEIRTPMNGVIGMADVLHQTSLQGYQVEMVDTIRDSAYSLLGIIEDILDFSKIEAGKLDIEQEPTAIAEVVEKACAMLDHLAVSKGVELTLFTDPAIPALILGDAQRLRQIVVNLANNAIKFSSGQECTGRVSVRAVLVERGPAQAVVDIRVADNGIGMDQATQARLFTAFTQGEASTTRRFGGTGLGLSIARNLLNLMGGDISVKSAPGEGSTFCAHLPCVPVGDQAGAGAEASPVAGLRCLVLGAAEGLADDWAAWLAAAGAQVERAPDLTAARDCLAAPGPWLCLIDAGNVPAAPDELRAIADARPEGSLRFLVIGRGVRRRLRRLDKVPALFELDGNVLTRQDFLAAVAVAAGLAAEKPSEPARGRIDGLTPPARNVALSQGRLILVAEDNATNQKVIVRQLALLGLAADLADDGRAALARWKSGDYALLLSDLHMPQMDGYELTAAIRAEEQGMRHTPIIALTANALKGEAQRCLDAGMDDYLAKPTPLTELQAMLEKWLPAATDSRDTAAVPPAPTFAVKHDPPSRERGWGEGAQGAASSAALDVSVLAALVGDDPTTIREFLFDFRASTTSIAAELSAACAASDAAQAGALAHKLKSAARAVGATALGDLCAEIEQAGKTGNKDALGALHARFEREMAAVDAQLPSSQVLPGAHTYNPIS